MKKLRLLFFLFLSVSVYSDELEDVISALQKNIDKVQDLQCSALMSIDMGEMGTYTQSMKLWTKGRDKMRMEMEASPGLSVNPSPMGQKATSGKVRMIINGDKVIMESEGKREVLSSDGSSLYRRQAAPPGGDFQRDFREFLKQNKVSIVSRKKSVIKNLLSRSEPPKEVVLEVVPKEKDPIVQKIEMTVDMERGVITNQKMFSNYGTTKMDMEYENIKGVWVIKRINMIIPTPMGKAGKMTIEYKNVKLNEGISDRLFME
ncbi:MAG: hypothetical protein ABIN61_09230 [candidate division WOR-3 bacterium]